MYTMTHITIHVQSYCLGKPTTIHVILPTIMNPIENPGRISFKGPFRTLYFLHGAQDDPEDVMARTRIGDYAMENNIAVVLPEGNNAFYLDQVPGFGYESFITDELIEATRELLPLSPKREDTFIGGYSMGGYGAVRASLLHPEKFAACISLSGALEIKRTAYFVRALTPLIPEQLREPKVLPGSNYDLFHLLRGIKAPEDAGASENEKPVSYPSFYFACGSDDPFISQTKAFLEAAADSPLRTECHFTPGGHDFPYWDAALSEVMQWLNTI